jgi:3-methyladenine DNA glycosylase/8-oxoguanine DNA glycosylase
MYPVERALLRWSGESLADGGCLMARRTIESLNGPIDLVGTMAPLSRGRGDPTFVIGGGDVLRSTRTPEGPATVWLRMSDETIEAEAWGPGAERALDDVPGWVGVHDDWSSFEPHHDIVRQLRRDHPGLRLTRSGAVTATLIPAICEQRVTGLEARRAYRMLTRAVAEPAPGPGDLVLPPDPARIAALPPLVYHRAGIDMRRARVMRDVCVRADRLDALADRTGEEAGAALMSVPGIGPWTAAEVARLALGDPDAVSVGDYHLPNLVTWLLAGEPRGTDQRMLELLEPYGGHRARVQRLLEAAGVTAPRYGPRREVSRAAIE